MKPILQTERLLLRQMTLADLPALAAMLQDEETMTAYEGAFSDEETREWLDRQLLRYERDGFGLWAVTLPLTGEMIGQCGLTRQEIEGEEVLEVGYLFNRNQWHRGYAIEAAQAVKQFAFHSVGANEVYSIIRDTNIPSLNVAIRNGMLVRKRFVKHYRGVEMPHFALSAKRLN